MSDTRDTVERLRFLASGQDDPHSVAIAEAADEIERLSARLEVAQAASEAAVSKAQWQAVTNRELNEAAAEITRLRAALAAQVPQPAEFDHDIGTDRYTVHRGAFWWHVRIGDGTANVGKFYTRNEAEDMALKLLTAFRDGAFAQHRAAPGASPQPAAVPERQWVPTAYELETVGIVSRKQIDGSRLWAVLDGFGNVLNKAGEWEWEPMPSSRDDDFMARCRFASPLEARDAYMRHLAASPQAPADTQPQGSNV